METTEAALSRAKMRCEARCSASAAVGLATRCRSAPAQKKRAFVDAKTTAGVRRACGVAVAAASWRASAQQDCVAVGAPHLALRHQRLERLEHRAVVRVGVAGPM